MRRARLKAIYTEDENKTLPGPLPVTARRKRVAASSAASPVDYAAVAKALHDGGYRGCVSIEMRSAATLGFGVPIGIFFLLPYLVWDWMRARGDDWRTAIAFPSLMAGAEWIQARFTPLGSWGSAAYTQLENLPLLQLASLFGVAGISWLIYGVAAALDRAWVAPGPERRRWLVSVALALLCAHGYGWMRLAMAPTFERTIRAAAAGTDATFSGLPLPTDEEIQRIEMALFRRSRAAAEAGANLVVWNEASPVSRRFGEPVHRESYRRPTAWPRGPSATTTGKLEESAEATCWPEREGSPCHAVPVRGADSQCARGAAAPGGGRLRDRVAVRPDRTCGGRKCWSASVSP